MDIRSQTPDFDIEGNIPFPSPPVSTSPPPSTLGPDRRADFLKKLNFAFYRYTLAKKQQIQDYGENVAAEYLPGREPPELVQKRREAEAKFLEEIEASDDEDSCGDDSRHQIGLREGATVEVYSLPTPLISPDSPMLRAPPRRKRRRAGVTDQEEEDAQPTKMARITIHPTTPITATAPRIAPTEPSAEPKRAGRLAAHQQPRRSARLARRNPRRSARLHARSEQLGRSDSLAACSKAIDVSPSTTRAKRKPRPVSVNQGGEQEMEAPGADKGYVSSVLRPIIPKRTRISTKSTAGV